MKRWGSPVPGRRGAAETYVTLGVPLDSGSPPSLEALETAFTSVFTLDGANRSETVEEAFPERVADRYQRKELLGRGGAGEVWRMWDEQLRRPVAMKVLYGARSQRSLARFEEEARVAAQLQHPGIVPIYDIGRLDDGRLWFTMKEVRGPTLEELIVKTHREWRLGRETTWSFRRLLEGFHRVCETMAYVHSMGVVHRDIKPSNIMFGDYGEVLVLDWGLAKVLEEAAIERMSSRTTQGLISGTPNYMSPEQAQGRSEEVGPPADVYALGATLYDLLAERPPRVDRSVPKLLMRVARGNPPIAPPSSRPTGAPQDEELDAIVLKALAVDPADRYPTAAELAIDLAHWLDGVRRRERAMKLVQRARADLELAERLEQEGADQLRDAEAMLEALPVTAEVERKEPAWDLEDRAKQRLCEAADTRNRAIQSLRAALTHADLPEAHDALADALARRHRLLEESGRHDEARMVASDLRIHDRSRRYVTYLEGTGAVSLRTSRPTEVLLYRYVEEKRRLRPRFQRSLGMTPLVEVPLPMGSYLLVLRAEDGVEVRYPVWIRRQEHWDGIDPRTGAPSVVRIPHPGELGPDDRLVPQGWCWVGDDVFEHTLPLERVWTDAFVIRAFPVTVREYVAYLNRLLEEGRQEAFERAMPTFLGSDREPYLKLHDGRVLEVPRRIDGVGTTVSSPLLPQTVVTHDQALAYAEACGWALPTQIQWQHAARGADRRVYPWGDHYDPSWMQMRFSEGDLLPVHSRPVDCSPYGVRGMAGNIMEWTADMAGPMAFAVGGHFGAGPRTCTISSRSSMRPGFRNLGLGFRLIRSWDPE